MSHGQIDLAFQSAAGVRVGIGSNVSYAFGELGPDPSDPCSGASNPITYTLRFDRGRLLIYGPDGSMGFDGGYEVRGDVMTIRDAKMDNISGSYELRFRLDGDRVSFQLLGRGATDAFFVATWQSGPFVKKS